VYWNLHGVNDRPTTRDVRRIHPAGTAIGPASPKREKIYIFLTANRVYIRIFIGMWQTEKQALMPYSGLFHALAERQLFLPNLRQ